MLTDDDHLRVDYIKIHVLYFKVEFANFNPSYTFFPMFIIHINHDVHLGKYVDTCTHKSLPDRTCILNRQRHIHCI